jgi:hypothetical protein
MGEKSKLTDVVLLYSSSCCQISYNDSIFEPAHGAKLCHAHRTEIAWRGQNDTHCKQLLHLDVKTTSIIRDPATSKT